MVVDSHKALLPQQEVLEAKGVLAVVVLLRVLLAVEEVHQLLEVMVSPQDKLVVLEEQGHQIQ